MPSQLVVATALVVTKGVARSSTLLQLPRAACAFFGVRSWHAPEHYALVRMRRCNRASMCSVSLADAQVRWQQRSQPKCMTDGLGAWHAGAFPTLARSHGRLPLQAPARSFSVMDATSLVSEAFVGIKTATGLPWWAIFAATGVVVRMSLFPVSIYMEKYKAASERLAPLLAEWSSALKYKVYAESNQKNLSQDEADKILAVESRKKSRELRKAKGLQQWKMYAAMVAPLPLWLLVSISIRQLCIASPSEDMIVLQMLATEGLPWQVDLKEPDELFILPMLTAASNIFATQFQHALRPRSSSKVIKNIEDVDMTKMTKMQRKELMKMHNAQQFPAIFTSIGILMFPIYAHLPTGLVLYWFVSSVGAFAQNFVLRFPSVRRQLGIPTGSREMAAPMTLAFRMMRKDLSAFFAEVKEKNFRRKPQ